MPNINLPPKIKPISELEKENPQLFKVMKKYQPKRFGLIDFLIVSQPQTHPTNQVYGVFVVDKKEAKIHASSKKVKQDFLVFNQKTQGVKYYRGLLKGEKPDGVLRPISEFCQEYGGGGKYYGCYRDGNVWKTTQHHYIDEKDPNLPGEDCFRKNVGEKLSQAMKSGNLIDKLLMWLRRLF